MQQGRAAPSRDPKRSRPRYPPCMPPAPAMAAPSVGALEPRLHAGQGRQSGGALSSSTRPEASTASPARQPKAGDLGQDLARIPPRTPCPRRTNAGNQQDPPANQPRAAIEKRPRPKSPNPRRRRPKTRDRKRRNGKRPSANGLSATAPSRWTKPINHSRLLHQRASGQSSPRL